MGAWILMTSMQVRFRRRSGIAEMSRLRRLTMSSPVLSLAVHGVRTFPGNEAFRWSGFASDNNIHTTIDFLNPMWYAASSCLTTAG